ncbi:MAG: hydroxymethylbilane synthase, partial [Anaerolineae bacterium]|nr:hydroxymethylbilane synthase [Anaerolineae bacterium]
YPHIEIVIRTITTRGDTHTDAPLPQIGDKGLFTRELEAALLAGEIHCAVHSLKDLPTQSPISNLQSLTIAAITERADARDVLISRHNLDLNHLPRGARIGTSSLRRAAQLRAYRPDVHIVNLRGNVDTRLRKAQSDEYDAIVLAAAGVLRLGHAERITEFLSFDVMLPAPGQGALAVQTRADDTTTRALLEPLDHAPTRAATTAERAFLRALGGGCQVPIAAYGEVNGDTLRLRGLVASTDGTRVVRGEVSGAVMYAEELGERLAMMLKREA